jgi:hypothetical protein
MNAWWSKLTRRLSAVREAGAEADPVLLVQIGAFAAIVPLLMRLKFSRLQERFSRRLAGSPSRFTADAVLRHFQLARRIGSPLVHRGCLTRGVTLCYFLRRAGIDVTLRFGMSQAGGAFTGHCWLVKDGVPFLEDKDPRPLYAHIVSIPAEAVDGTAMPPFKARDVWCAL